MCDYENKAKEIVEKYVPEKVWLGCIGRGDSLDDNHRLLQECIEQNSYSPIYEMWEDYNCDYRYQMAVEEFKEIEKKMADDGVFAEPYEEYIMEELYARDQFDPADELLKHTSEIVMFYSTGEEIPDMYGADDEEDKEYLDKIKEILEIKDDKYDEKILDMMHQASGGELRIYFTRYLEKMVSCKMENNEVKDFTTIRFSGKVAVAIADSINGSGDHCFVETDVTFPFKRSNLFVDGQVKYSYTYEVCGMTSDWCNDTEVEFGYEETEKEIKESQSSEWVERQKKYDETFKAGGCTFGDMNITRHRDVYYRNEYPAGNKCPHCGTFWID